MSESASDNVLFISHTASDHPFALALKTAIHALVGSETIDVRYSTSDEAGPQGGEKWREWIYRQVVEARTTLVVVTPQAIGKPWLLWEAGACWGAALTRKALANEEGVGESGEHPGGMVGSRLLVTLAYGLSASECPDPLSAEQIVDGARDGAMEKVFDDILEAHGLSLDLIRKATKRMEGALASYTATVGKALLEASSLVTEANVQEWLARLDEIEQDAERRGARPSVEDLRHYERWMRLAFGRDLDETGTAAPIDVRLHRRLGQLFLRLRQFEPAARQLKLARRAAPRDIYVLRPLGEARLKHHLAGKDPAADDEARKEIEGLLAAIKELDREAFVATPDAAALYGKYLRRARGDRPRAIEVYSTAFAACPDSYYLADLLAQTQLEEGLLEEARATYRRALEILDKLDELDVWSCATSTTAWVALGDHAGALASLQELPELDPEPSEVESVVGGLREVAQRSGYPDEGLEELLAVLPATWRT